jgi:hypothetical protein
VSEGWLIRDGEVLASGVRLEGLAGFVVAPRSFSDGIGALVVEGPAVVLRSPVVRMGESGRIGALDVRGPVRFVGPGHHAVIVRRDIADRLRVGDEIHFRVTT